MLQSNESFYVPPDLKSYSQNKLAFLQSLSILIWRNWLGFGRDPIHAKVKLS